MKNQIRLHLEGERYGKLVVTEEAEPIYPMRRKTPCFSYGDIRRVHRIYASN